MRKNLMIGALIALGLGGCGGGGDYTPVDQNHTGTLTDSATQHDGRTCDTYEIQLGRGWHVTADMTSEWDNYLYLAKLEDVATNDDTNGTNARIDTDVEMSGGYTVYACSYGTSRGPYQLHITTRGPG
jgi:hypothetical protein